MQESGKNIFDFGRKPNFVTILWFIAPFIAVLVLLNRGDLHINNYLIFKNVFWHSVQEQHLYHLYPTEYSDKNHYGPCFSVLIAPFSSTSFISGANAPGCIFSYAFSRSS